MSRSPVVPVLGLSGVLLAVVLGKSEVTSQTNWAVGCTSSGLRKRAELSAVVAEGTAEHGVGPTLSSRWMVTAGLAPSAMVVPVVPPQPTASRAR